MSPRRRTSIDNAAVPVVETEQVPVESTPRGNGVQVLASALRQVPQRYEAQVSLDRLREHPENPRRGDLRSLEESVTTLGFYGALYVQEGTGYVLAGNHRYRQLRLLGASAVDVIWLQVDAATARKILLVDNRVGDLGTYDTQALARVLDDLLTTDSLAGTGYSVADLDALLQSLPPVEDVMPGAGGRAGAQEPSAQAEWAGMPAFTQEEQSAYHTVKIHLADAAAMTWLAAQLGQQVSLTTKYLWVPAQERLAMREQAYVVEQGPDAAGEEA
jgi:ParB-like chromosome segregation protein Spo0J